jgi:hypothetical protein
MKQEAGCKTVLPLVMQGKPLVSSKEAKMTKGHQGESCSEAIRAVINPEEVVAFSELYQRVKRRGVWKDETIWQHLMSLVVNLPPARRHWKTSVPFLFIHADGRYELYDPLKHPQVIT